MTYLSPSQEKIPRFSLGAGFGAIAAYLFGSVPFIMIVLAINMPKIMSSSAGRKPSEQTEIFNHYLQSTWVMAGAILSQCIALFIFVLIVSKVRGTGHPLQDIGIRFSRKSPLFFIGGFIFQFIGIIMIIPITLLAGEPPEQGVVTAVRDSIGMGFIILMVMAVVFAPIAEEICFRGLFLRTLPKTGSFRSWWPLLNKITPVWAVIIAGITFGMVHLADPNALVGLPILVMVGIISSALTIYRGRIDASIFFHMGFNAATVAVIVFSR